MPRTGRQLAAGHCFHVFNRGNARAEVFHKEADYQAFVKLIRSACARIAMRVLAFCIMPNHFHIVV